MIWFDQNTDDKAIACEYFCTAIFRAFYNRRRAEKLWQQVSAFKKGWSQKIVAHSNGAHVVVDMVRLHTIELAHLHLVCGACEADFNKNGLNRALASGQVKRVTVYTAGKDRALALAHTLPGRLLGYGTLGLHGPLNVLPSVADRVETVRSAPWDEYGHSECWGKDFGRTMRTFSESSDGEAA